MARARGAGTVHVIAHADGDALTLVVRDDGPGPPASGARRGVGLANTRDRLAQLYGDGAELRVEPGTDGGTTATIALPLRLAHPAAAAPAVTPAGHSRRDSCWNLVASAASPTMSTGRALRRHSQSSRSLARPRRRSSCS